MELFKSEEVKNAIYRVCQKRINRGMPEDRFYMYLTELLHTWRNNEYLTNYIKGLTYDQFVKEVK